MKVEIMKFNGPSRVWHRSDSIEELLTDFSFLDKISVLAVISVSCPLKNKLKIGTKHRIQFSIYDNESNSFETKIDVYRDKTKVRVSGWGHDEIFELLKEE
jgi:hypothetical protein